MREIEKSRAVESSLQATEQRKGEAAMGTERVQKQGTRRSVGRRKKTCDDRRGDKKQRNSAVGRMGSAGFFYGRAVAGDEDARN